MCSRRRVNKNRVVNAMCTENKRHRNNGPHKSREHSTQSIEYGAHTHAHTPHKLFLILSPNDLKHTDVFYSIFFSFLNFVSYLPFDCVMVPLTLHTTDEIAVWLERATETTHTQKVETINAEMQRKKRREKKTARSIQ